jgi:anti-sigma B factor antagonist
MELRQRQVDGAIVVALSGDGIGSEPSTLHQLVVSLLDRGHRRIVLDVAQLKYIDSTCLAEIVASYKATVARGGSLKMTPANAHIRRLLQVTKVDTFIHVYDSVADAIASFDVASRTS